MSAVPPYGVMLFRKLTVDRDRDIVDTRDYDEDVTDMLLGGVFRDIDER